MLCQVASEKAASLALLGIRVWLLDIPRNETFYHWFAEPLWRLLSRLVFTPLLAAPLLRGSIDLGLAAADGGGCKGLLLCGYRRYVGTLVRVVASTALLNCLLGAWLLCGGVCLLLPESGCCFLLVGIYVGLMPLFACLALGLPHMVAKVLPLVAGLRAAWADLRGRRLASMGLAFLWAVAAVALLPSGMLPDQTGGPISYLFSKAAGPIFLPIIEPSMPLAITLTLGLPVIGALTVIAYRQLNPATVSSAATGNR